MFDIQRYVALVGTEIKIETLNYQTLFASVSYPLCPLRIAGTDRNFACSGIYRSYDFYPVITK